MQAGISQQAFNWCARSSRCFRSSFKRASSACEAAKRAVARPWSERAQGPAPAALAAWRPSLPSRRKNARRVSSVLCGLKSFGAACKPQCESRSRASAGRQQPSLWSGLLVETTTGLATVKPPPLRRTENRRALQWPALQQHWTEPLQSLCSENMQV